MDQIGSVYKEHKGGGFRPGLGGIEELEPALSRLRGRFDSNDLIQRPVHGDSDILVYEPTVDVPVYFVEDTAPLCRGSTSRFPGASNCGLCGWENEVASLAHYPEQNEEHQGDSRNQQQPEHEEIILV